MTNFIKNFASDDSGVTAMEYGMIAALVAVAIIAVVGDLGQELNATFTKIEGDLNKANNPTP